MTCPYGDHPVHLELDEQALRAALRVAIWPPTADLVPPCDETGTYDWVGFYLKRIHLGVLAVYPRALTAPLAFAVPPVHAPARLLEVLMVPRWAHHTDLYKTGVQSARQSYLSKLFGCCEYARLHAALSEVWPQDGPVIYGITHRRFAEFSRNMGYYCQDAPPDLTAIYRPAILGIVARDHPIRADEIADIYFVHTPSSVSALESINAKIAAYAQDAAARLAQLGGPS